MDDRKMFLQLEADSANTNILLSMSFESSLFNAMILHIIEDTPDDCDENVEIRRLAIEIKEYFKF